MNKLKWKYDKRHKQWYCNHDGNIGFTIIKEEGEWQLKRNGLCDYVAWFNKLSSAKEVARLIVFG